MTGKNPKTELCTACGEYRLKTTLVLLVGDPAGGLAVDLKGKLAGGVFVCCNHRCLARLEVESLAGALGIERLDAQAVAALPELISAALVKRLKSLLGIAQRGGNLVSGSDVARAALKLAPPGEWLALVAEDASPNSARQLCRTVQARGVTLARCLTTIEIGDCIGKSPRSIVVIQDAGLANSALAILSRLDEVAGRETGAER